MICSKSGAVETIVDENDAGDGIELYDGLISPGFINAHCHLELSHLKGAIPEHLGLVDFVQQVMSMRNADAAVKFDAMKIAADAFYTAGTVAIGDICNTADSIDIKKISSLYFHNFIELSGFVEGSAQARFDAGQAIKGKFKSSIPQYKTTLTAHAPYSVSGRLFSLINDDTAHQVVSVHNQESKEEDELYLNKMGGFLKLYENFGIDISSFRPSGKRSLPAWVPYFNNDQSIIAVHNLFTSQADLSLISFNQRFRKLYACICINANQYIEDALPPLQLLRDNNISLLIGTDSFASNHQLDMMQEIKSLHETFPHISMAEILTWATLNGAEALNIQDRYGSFDEGKTPGVVLIKNYTSIRIL